MGPQASLRFHELLIEKSRKHQSGEGDEFPFIVHFSVPVADFISDETREDAASAMLNDLDGVIRQLEPGTITLACNTAHILVDRVAILRRPEFRSMLEAVADEVERRGIRRVGLLATPTAIRAKLYENVLAKRGIKTLLPRAGQIGTIETAIRSVISGENDLRLKAKLTDIANSFEGRGAEAILLGCTELPLIFDGSKSNVPVFDCLDVYADAVIGQYYLYNGV
jgi:aspartate racemase